jgi:hypothetical protein
VARHSTVAADTAHIGEAYRGYDHRVTATSRSAQIDLGPATLSYVWIFENGKVVHLQSYRDRADALDAAGSRKR